MLPGAGRDGRGGGGGQGGQAPRPARAGAAGRGMGGRGRWGGGAGGAGGVGGAGEGAGAGEVPGRGWAPAGHPPPRGPSCTGNPHLRSTTPAPGFHLSSIQGMSCQPLPQPYVMSLLVSVALFYTMTNTLSWDLSGDVLPAPASALCGWRGVKPLSRRPVASCCHVAFIKSVQPRDGLLILE